MKKLKRCISGACMRIVASPRSVCRMLMSRTTWTGVCSKSKSGDSGSPQENNDTMAAASAAAIVLCL